jgi:hypothetical protein
MVPAAPTKRWHRSVSSIFGAYILYTDLCHGDQTRPATCAGRIKTEPHQHEKQRVCTSKNAAWDVFCLCRCARRFSFRGIPLSTRAAREIEHMGLTSRAAPGIGSASRLATRCCGLLTHCSMDSWYACGNINHINALCRFVCGANHAGNTMGTPWLSFPASQERARIALLAAPEARTAPPRLGLPWVPLGRAIDSLSLYRSPRSVSEY